VRAPVLDRIALGLDRGSDVVEATLEEVVLVAVVSVERRSTDVGAIDDVLHRDPVVAPLQDQLPERVPQEVPGPPHGRSVRASFICPFPLKSVGYREDRKRTLVDSPRLAHARAANGFFSRLCYVARTTDSGVHTVEWRGESWCSRRWQAHIRPDGFGQVDFQGGFLQVAAALIAAVASVIGSALTFIVGIRSLRRSVSTSNGEPLGRALERRLDRVERRLDGMERSISEMRQWLAFREGGSDRFSGRPAACHDQAGFIGRDGSGVVSASAHRPRARRPAPGSSEDDRHRGSR
jgi:Replication-relaxation